MTVRRTARDASTVVEASARQPLDPRALVVHSRAQFQQATREALLHHEQSVPEPTPYTRGLVVVAEGVCDDGGG